MKKVIKSQNTPRTHIITADDPDNHNGVWRFRVSYYDSDLDNDGNTDDAVVIGDASALTDYLHGPPAAPTGFTAHNAGPDARRLVWDKPIPGPCPMSRGIPPTRPTATRGQTGMRWPVSGMLVPMI